MKYELKSVSPARLAKISGAVCGVMFLFVALFAVPMFMFAPFPEEVEGQPPKIFFLVALMLYPLMGAFWGWLMGQISARIYNFAARKMGGVVLEVAILPDVAGNTGPG